MDNKYLNLLEKMTLDQLHAEVQATRLLEPEKTASVYEHMVDRVEDFNDKLQYQRLASRYSNQSQNLAATEFDALQEAGEIIPMPIVQETTL